MLAHELRISALFIWVAMCLLYRAAPVVQSGTSAVQPTLQPYRSPTPQPQPAESIFARVEPIICVCV
jgi:hypothetical protein